MLFPWFVSVMLATAYTVSGVWDQQCVDNCSCCIDERCKSGLGWPNVCTSGCIDGHRGARCYELCQYENCKSCGFLDSDRTCTACYDGFYLGPNKDCASECPSNCKSCTSSTKCTECKDGFYDKDGSTTCTYAYCPQNCECTTGGKVCISCKKGYYDTSFSCNKSCPANCSTCESGDSCSECKSGFYNGYEYDNDTSLLQKTCTYACRNLCTKCLSYSNCSQCINGKYGRTCQGECSVGCKDKTCSSDNGQCNCTNNFTGNNCLDCIIGKYGLYCNQTCPVLCDGNRCDSPSGYCSSGCINENITGDTCNMCKEGMYGDYCDSQCPKNCKYSRCKRNSGTCSEGCKGNFNGTKCEICMSGKFGKDCEQDCPGNCAGNICEKMYGTCKDCIHNFDGQICNKCKYGYYGRNCDELCSQNCANFTCDRESGKCLNDCQDGYSGDRCCVLSKNCVECFNNTKCKTCRSGYYQNTCNKSCPEGCLGSCNISTGECRNCQNNRFGQFCDMNCSENCDIENVNNNRSCAKPDGTCYRCLDGFFSPSCRNKCSELCIDKICRQNDGVCINGREEQQKQPECILGERKEILTDPTTSESIVGPVVGGIAGVLILLAGVVVIVLFYKRRQRRQDSDHSNVKNGKASLNTNDNSAGFVGDGHENQNSHGNELLRNNLNLQAEELDDEVIVVDEQSEEEPDDSAYYNYTSIKVANLFSYVTKDHLDFFERDFKNLPKPCDLSTLCSIARRPENAASNRYRSIYPFDKTRVTIPDEPTFFINASYIDGYKRSKAYIASLGPTIMHTENFTTFWRMIWHEKSDIIVMLTNLRETSGMKCEQYWPEKEMEQCYGQIKVKCRSEEEFAEYTVRCFTISKGTEERNLTQVQFTAWPDRGVPSEVTSLVDFRQRVKAAPIVFDGPVIVHCSAGVGRTGTYIALDILSEQGEAEHSVDVFSCVSKLRGQRVSMVQTAEQYVFLHKTLVHTLTFGCKALPAEELQSLAFDSERTLTKIFQTLKQEVDIERKEEVAARKENKKTYADKCRHHSDIPGNRGRVRIFLQRESGNHDFINAVFINSFKVKGLFLAAQTPKSNTLEDFLCMVYQQNSSCVVSLEDPLELSKKHDIGIYLPPDNETYRCGEFTVTSSKYKNKPLYTIKKLSIKHIDKGKERIAYHFQYTKWVNNRKVAESPVDFVKFVKDIETYVKQRERDEPNILVHCLNAYERSGLFCVVYTLLEKLEAERQVSVVNVIRKIRAQRKLSITSVDQLRFCYQCISAYLESYTTYSNFAV